MRKVYDEALGRRTARDVADLLPRLPDIVRRQDIRHALGAAPGRNPREFLSVERRLESGGYLLPLANGVYERNGRPLRQWRKTGDGTQPPSGLRGDPGAPRTVTAPTRGSSSSTED